MNLLKTFLLTSLILFSFVLKANPIKRTNNFNSYKDPLNEIGYGINAAFLKNEKILAPELNLYYSRYLTSYFSIGVSYCGIYSKNYHNALSAKLSFKVLKNLIISFSPGLYLKSDGVKNNLLYFFGFEGAYQFKLSDNIGLGPMVDIQMIQDDLYMIGGFQMGFYF